MTPRSKGLKSQCLFLPQTQTAIAPQLLPGRRSPPILVSIRPAVKLVPKSRELRSQDTEDSRVRTWLWEEERSGDHPTQGPLLKAGRCQALLRSYREYWSFTAQVQKPCVNLLCASDIILGSFSDTREKQSETLAQAEGLLTHSWQQKFFTIKRKKSIYSN